MGVCSPCPECAHSSITPFAPGGPWLGSSRNEKRRAFQRNMRIELLKMQVGRNLSMLEGQHNFYHACNPRGSFQVPDIGLHRTQDTGLSIGARLTNGCGEGLDLNGIA